MNQIKSKLSSFQFSRFIINRSLIEIREKKPSKSLSIHFEPRGTFTRETGKFDLFLNVKIEDNTKAILIEIDSVGFFLLQGVEQEKMLKSYLYLNAPAILFPYLRAYIASLSTLSGAITPITLPTLNLTNIGKELEKNTVFI